MDWGAIIELLNTAGLAGLLVLFIRGDIISRAAVEDITERVVSRSMERIDALIEQRFDEHNDKLCQRLDTIALQIYTHYNNPGAQDSLLDDMADRVNDKLMARTDIDNNVFSSYIERYLDSRCTVKEHDEDTEKRRG